MLNTKKKQMPTSGCMITCLNILFLRNSLEFRNSKNYTAVVWYDCNIGCRSNIYNPLVGCFNSLISKQVWFIRFFFPSFIKKIPVRWGNLLPAKQRQPVHQRTDFRCSLLYSRRVRPGGCACSTQVPPRNHSVLGFGTYRRLEWLVPFGGTSILSIPFGLPENVEWGIPNDAVLMTEGGK